MASDCTITAVTDNQREALENLIAISGDASDLGKQAAIWMIRQTINLSLPCYLRLEESFDRWKRVADDFIALISAIRYSRIDLVLAAMGSDMQLCLHDGQLVGQELDATAGGCTIWICLKRDIYSRSAKQLSLDLSAIEAIELQRASG